MKRILLGGVWLLCLSVPVWAQADGGFLATLKPEESAAAGLAKLTPGEREQLQRLVEAYKNTSRSPANTTREPLVAAPLPPTDATKTVVLKPGTKIEYATIHSTIAGEFEGWKPGQILTLSNGQRWRVSDEDRYYIRRSSNPAVEITPSKFGGYWMNFPALKARVRVELVSAP